MKYIAGFVLLISLIGCKKDEILLSGDIKGVVKTYSQHYALPASDQSGALVRLIKDKTVIDSMVADAKGEVEFNDLPYGTYKLTVEKEKYIQRYDYPFIVNHVGGYSPSIAELELNEIPDFELTIDSFVYLPVDHNLKYYVSVNGGDAHTLVSNIGYILKVFASNSPDVSSENYSSIGNGYLFNGVEPMYARTLIYYDFDSNFEQLKTETIYLRIYPLAWGQGYSFKAYYPEALGKPSNVISINWDSLPQ